MEAATASHKARHSLGILPQLASWLSSLWATYFCGNLQPQCTPCSSWDSPKRFGQSAYLTALGSVIDCEKSSMQMGLARPRLLNSSPSLMQHSHPMLVLVRLGTARSDWSTVCLTGFQACLARAQLKKPIHRCRRRDQSDLLSPPAPGHPASSAAA